MFKYKGIKCPVCEKEFTENDNIAVCPDCGAPYHKECVKETGCILKDLHEKGENFEFVKDTHNEPRFDANSEKRCSRCGTVNPSDRLNCELCGTPLNREEGIPFSNENIPHGYIPFNPFINPLGGVNPDEDIEEVPVKDLALFVRENTHYYLPRFKSVSKNGKGGFSWCAFLFDFYFFIYRKMWGMAIVSLIVSLVLGLPQLVSVFEMTKATIMGLSEIPEPSQSMVVATQVCSFLSFALKFLFGIFANSLYAKMAFRKVKKLKKVHGDKEDYSTILSKKGGTSKLALILCFIIPYGLSMIAYFIMSIM